MLVLGSRKRYRKRNPHDQDNGCYKGVKIRRSAVGEKGAREKEMRNSGSLRRREVSQACGEGEDWTYESAGGRKKGNSRINRFKGNIKHKSIRDRGRTDRTRRGKKGEK